MEWTALPTLEPTIDRSAPGTDAGTDGGTATLTPYPTLTSTPTVTATPTTTPALTDVPSESFDEHEIERIVGEYINDRRPENDLSRLDHEGDSVDDRVEMTRSYSVRMADVDEAIHRIDGQTSAHRYRSNDLYERCR